MFCAVGSARHDDDDEQGVSAQPEPPDRGGGQRLPTSLSAASSAIRSTPPGRCPSRRATPKATSMHGTARFPMRVSGSSSTGGSATRVTEGTSPQSAEGDRVPEQSRDPGDQPSAGAGELGVEDRRLTG